MGEMGYYALGLALPLWEPWLVQILAAVSQEDRGCWERSSR